MAEGVKITPEDVPQLDRAVIGTGSCQTVRPGNPDSIARCFVDQGAAAYSGFVYSPNEGYLIGEFDGLPFRYTWPDFPNHYALGLLPLAAFLFTFVLFGVAME